MTEVTTVLYEFGLIFLFALIPSLMSGYLNRFLISRSFGIERYKYIMKEIRDFDRQMLEAARAKDESKLNKLKSKKPYIDKMRAQTFKISMVNMFVMLTFYYIFFIFIFTQIFSTQFEIYFPLFYPDFKITIYYWYIITLFMMGLIINRILGIYYA